jgi:O-antigen/teichoic acid export membrane protein
MTPETGRSRFVSNTAALAASTVLSAVLTLVQVKILAGHLPPGEFGAFAALRGFSLLVAMLAANGLPQLLVRFLPLLESTRRLSGAVVLSGVCFFAPLFLLTVFVFIVETHRSLFFNFLPVEWPIAAGESSSMFLWFYATTLGVTLKLVMYGGFNGLRRMPAQVILEVTSLIVQVAWIYMWRDQLTLSRLFMILGVTSLAACAVGLPWYFARLHRDLTGDRATGTGRAEGPGYGGYWLGATGMSLVALAFTDVDRYVLSQVLALEVLSQFHIGSRILRLVNRFLSVPVLAFQPEVSRLEAEQRDQAIRTTTSVFFKFNTAIATAAAFALVTLAPEIVRLVANEQYDAAAPLLRILALSIPLTAMTAPLTAVMKALDQVRAALYCDLVWAAVYVALLLQLGGAYGLAGVGIAQVSASFVQLAMALSLSRVRPKLADAVKAAAVSAASAAAVFAPIALAGVFLPSSPATFAVKVALVLPAIVMFKLLAVNLLRVFTEGERDTLVSLLSNRGLRNLARWVA